MPHNFVVLFSTLIIVRVLALDFLEIPWQILLVQLIEKIKTSSGHRHWHLSWSRPLVHYASGVE